MDVIESIKKDKAYMKCKLIVKSWEKDFKLKHSRTPSKFDIKEAPSNIKYAYKKYFHLKSEALESSLTVCDAETENNCSPVSNEYPDLEADAKLTNEDQDSLISVLPSGPELAQLISNSKVPRDEVCQSPFVENLSKKLFHNRKFSIRNPRKMQLTKSQPDSKNDNVIYPDNKENVFSDSSCKVLYDNELKNVFGTVETITDFKTVPDVKYDATNLNINNTLDITKNSSLRHINTAWLERASGVSCDKDIEKIDKEVKSANDVQKFGISNVSLHTPVEKPCDYIENSESDEETLVENLKPALKKRKIEIICSPPTLNSQSGEESLNKETIKTKSKHKRYTKTSKTSKASKELIPVDEDALSAQPPDIREYLPFGCDKEVTPLVSKVADLLVSIETSSSSVKHDYVSNQELTKLEKKIQSGTINENFVKINIDKKVYVRGKKNFNFSKYKKKQWKDKKALHGGMEFPESGKISCFKCGQCGHMARYCTSHKENSLLPLQNTPDNEIPTLEDMQKLVLKETSNESIEEELSANVFTSSQIPEHVLKLLADNPVTDRDIKPVFTDKNQNMEELYEALQLFGHQSFKPGQEEAITRILCGKSTLLILSTGGGKSLCYQLPAYIYSKNYECITLVISPLVSLMEDQVISMPDFLKAGCLHTNQPPTQRRKIMEYLKKGEINILLISPEALISGDTSNGFAGLFRSLPKIAFACIDEAHCVSQWSHNFRPSYLMICRILREKLNVQCILGLTATASQSTIKSVVDHIHIPDGLKGVVENPTLPDNLHLSMSFEANKDKALVTFLTSDKIINFTSIIVYCIRRNECERVAAILRSLLAQPGKINMEKMNNKRKRMSYIAEAYHAGMSAAQRKKIQKHFMDGTLKIIVATVAFGMGINKPDIRCIIHYNMPASFESYVQEVGRAGRDGLAAFCHVFINDSSSDKNELLKHIYANSIDRPIIRKLLQKVFVSCQCSKEKRKCCSGHEVGIPIDSTVEELDMPSENIATLLCYVELHPKHYIKVLNNSYVNCKILSYGGPQKILEAAKNCPPLAMAYLVESKKDPSITKSNIFEFNVIEIAAAIGWESGMVKYHLKNLEWLTVGGMSQRSQLKVEFNNLGFRIKAKGDLTPAELDDVLDDLHKTVRRQEQLSLYQLEEIDGTFRKLCNFSVEKNILSEELLFSKSNQLKSIINNYFQRENSLLEDINIPERPLDIDRAVSDIRALISTYRDCTFTGRSIARIFQGISSPNFPALVWGRCKYWRSHIHEDFNGLTRIATQEILHMK